MPVIGITYVQFSLKVNLQMHRLIGNNTSACSETTIPEIRTLACFVTVQDNAGYHCAVDSASSFYQECRYVSELVGLGLI